LIPKVAEFLKRSCGKTKEIETMSDSSSSDRGVRKGVRESGAFAEPGHGGHGAVMWLS